jgi:hypothetical protein
MVTQCNRKGCRGANAGTGEGSLIECYIRLAMKEVSEDINGFRDVRDGGEYEGSGGRKGRRKPILFIWRSICESVVGLQDTADLPPYGFASCMQKRHAGVQLEDSSSGRLGLMISGVNQQCQGGTGDQVPDLRLSRGAPLAYSAPTARELVVGQWGRSCLEKSGQ